jgi:hypothetical protein
MLLAGRCDDSLVFGSDSSTFVKGSFLSRLRQSLRTTQDVGSYETASGGALVASNLDDGCSG